MNNILHFTDEDDREVATASLRHQYADAEKRIAECGITWRMEAIGPSEARYLLNRHATAAKQRGIDAGLTDETLSIDSDEVAVKQRKLNVRHVKKLAHQIEAGLWQLTPQGIAIGTDGWLADGQHRVEAILASNCVVPMWIADGVPDEVFPHLDRGRPRSDSEILQMQGKVDNPTVMATIRLLWLYDNVPELNKWTQKDIIPTGVEIIRYAAEHYGGLEQHLSATSAFGGYRTLTKTAAAGLRFVVHRHNPESVEDVDDFLMRVRRGFGADNQSATFALYEFVQRRTDPTRKHIFRDHGVSNYLFLVSLWSWRHYMMRSTVMRMGWQPRYGIPALP